jgi:hypothetical protein
MRKGRVTVTVETPVIFGIGFLKVLSLQKTEKDLAKDD